ncbi:MAG: hypothetical protein ABH871_05050 [Pseudomonadota bacterium]
MYATVGAISALPALIYAANALTSNSAAFTSCAQGFENAGTLDARFISSNPCSLVGPESLCSPYNPVHHTTARKAMMRTAGSENAFPRMLAAGAAAGLITTLSENAFAGADKSSDTDLISPMQAIGLILFSLVAVTIGMSFWEDRRQSKRVQNRKESCESVIHPPKDTAPVVLNSGRKASVENVDEEDVV